MAKINLDFTNVSEGGGLPVGDYICKITKVEIKDGDKAKYLEWELTVGLGEMKGQKTRHITSLSPKALFKLRDFIQATGQTVPKSIVQIDTDTIVGKVVGIEVVAGTYVDKKTNETKAKTDVKEVYEVKKTDAGWVRANAAPAVSLDEPAAPPWESGNDDVTEIEI